MYHRRGAAGPQCPGPLLVSVRERRARLPCACLRLSRLTTDASMAGQPAARCFLFSTFAGRLKSPERQSCAGKLAVRMGPVAAPSGKIHEDGTHSAISMQSPTRPGLATKTRRAQESLQQATTRSVVISRFIQMMSGRAGYFALGSFVPSTCRLRMTSDKIKTISARR